MKFNIGDKIRFDDEFYRNHQAFADDVEGIQIAIGFLIIKHRRWDTPSNEGVYSFRGDRLVNQGCWGKVEPHMKLAVKPYISGPKTFRFK
jgi:hypothetical protein